MPSDNDPQFSDPADNTQDQNADTEHDMNPMHEARNRDVVVVSAMSEQTLRDQLLVWLSDYMVAPQESAESEYTKLESIESEYINPALEHSLAVQLSNFYNDCPADTKLKFKRAVVDALFQWTHGWGSYCLESLLCLTAYINATDAIPRLRDYIEHIENYVPDADEQFGVVDTTLSVLRGFVTRADVTALFDEWFNLDTFDPRHAMQCFLALCKVSRENYYRHITRFMWWIQTYRSAGYWQLNHILDTFDEMVDTKVILRQLPLVPPAVRQDFIDLMYFDESSPYREVAVNTASSYENDNSLDVIFIHLNVMLDDQRFVDYPLEKYSKDARSMIKQEFRRKIAVGRKLQEVSERPTRTLRQKYLRTEVA